MFTETTLDNCAQEPIHIPGTIQPHGALLAFDSARTLAFVSANADTLLGMTSRLGADIADQQLPDAIVSALVSWFDLGESEFEPFSASIADSNFDVIGHRNVDALLIVEFEIWSQSAVSVASYALIAHRAIERLGRQKSIEDLLNLAAIEVRKITGFDRVMAYRFRHDDSGEVVRESRRVDLEPWEGLRYPSSDIPAQARRLYVLNKLRLIVKVDGEAVAILADRLGKPDALDMSFCGLRSVSPIHIEYLINIEVAASLSISIVIDGKLWGMIACHHSEPCHVPHGIRIACEVLAQMLSLSIATLETATVARRMARCAETLAMIGVRARAADDLLRGIAFDRPTPADLFDAGVTLCLWGGKFKVCAGEISSESVKALAEVLGDLQQDTIVSAKITDTDPRLAAAIAPFCGMLAVCFDVGHRGWVVWLRAEQIEHVRWAGKPEKVVKIGLNGPRLTPRGSFSEWIEDVRGSSTPWDRSDIETAHALRQELVRIAGAHSVDMERVRLELLATLGHDLRDPLHAISMAAQVLQRQRTDAVKLGARIQSSSGRMSRMVNQVLDMSLLQSNGGITLAREGFDAGALLREVVDEARFAYPDIEVTLVSTDNLLLRADRDRLLQVASNLLSNARNHGTLGTPITVFVRAQEDRIQFGVSNWGAAIAPELQLGLFKAFKPESSQNPRNRSGLGLGLYIASEIVKAHDGTLSLECRDGQIIFTADISNPR